MFTNGIRTLFRYKRYLSAIHPANISFVVNFSQFRHCSYLASALVLCYWDEYISLLFISQVPLVDSYEDMKAFFEELLNLARPAVLELVAKPALPILEAPDVLATAISGLSKILLSKI